MTPRGTPWASYIKIAEVLRLSVEALPAGALLPSEADLARQYGVARNTARRAFSVLEGEGLIRAVPGRGRVVSHPPPDENGAISRRDDALPVFRRVAGDLRESIAAERTAPGERLPSESALMAHYGVSRGTVRHALEVLEAEGLVTTVPGRGRFVCFRNGPGTGPPVPSGG